MMCTQSICDLYVDVSKGLGSVFPSNLKVPWEVKKAVPDWKSMTSFFGRTDENSVVLTKLEKVKNTFLARVFLPIYVAFEHNFRVIEFISGFFTLFKNSNFGSCKSQTIQLIKASSEVTLENLIKRKF